MQLISKARTLRTLGGVVAALAIVPWIGVGAAQASGGGDDSCATRPSGVSGDATCSLLLGPNGTKVFGETWAVRTSDNHLVVWTFPDVAVGSGTVNLCVRTSAAYPAKHQCNASDADNAWSGSSTTIDLSLKSAGVSADADVFWALGVEQGSSVAVSRGSQGAIPGTTPTPTSTATPTQTPTTTPSGSTTSTPSPSHTHTHTPTPTPTPSHTHTHTPTPTPTTTTTSPSPSVSPSTTTTTTPTHSTTPSPSVSATTTHTDGTTPSPSTSVLGTKLAHTGSDGVAGSLVLSIGLLAIGGILVVSAQTVPAASRRRH